MGFCSDVSWASPAHCIPSITINEPSSQIHPLPIFTESSQLCPLIAEKCQGVRLGRKRDGGPLGEEHHVTRPSRYRRARLILDYTLAFDKVLRLIKLVREYAWLALFNTKKACGYGGF